MVSFIEWFRKLFRRKKIEEVKLEIKPEKEILELKKLEGKVLKKAKPLKKRKIYKKKKIKIKPKIKPIRKKLVKKKIKPRKVLRRKKRIVKPVKPIIKPKKILRIKKEIVKPIIPTIKPKAKPLKKIVEKVPKKVEEERIETLVSDVMTRNVTVVRTNDTLSYVVQLLSEKNISGAPVVKGDNFVGVISESDILKVVEAKDLLSLDSLGLKKLKEIKVEEVMHRKPIVAYESTKLSDAADLMNKYDITRLPIINEKRNLVGIVTRRDIIRGIAKELLFRILKRKPEEVERLRMIETDIDEILKMVERTGSVRIDVIRRKLELPEDKIEEWGKILEKHNLLEVYYPPIGKPILRKKVK